MTQRTQGAGVHSVRVALDVLEAVAFSGQELGVTQVAEQLGLTKGSVHRHLLTLVERGYLTQNQTTARYGIGSKASMLARLAPDADIVRFAEGPMRDLRDRYGHSVVLSSMSQRGAQVMLTIAGTSAIEIGVRPGSELPFHASAQGKVLLAFASQPMQSRILAGPRPRFTPYTMTDAVEIERDLLSILQRGYCVAPQEALLGINAIAAPIFDESGTCVACVALVGSIQLLPADPPAALLKSLSACAQAISRKLGHDDKPVFRQGAAAVKPRRQRTIAARTGAAR